MCLLSFFCLTETGPRPKNRPPGLWRRQHRVADPRAPGGRLGAEAKQFWVRPGSPGMELLAGAGEAVRSARWWRYRIRSSHGRNNDALLVEVALSFLVFLSGAQESHCDSESAKIYVSHVSPSILDHIMNGPGFDHGDGSLYLRMVGSCSGCAQSHATLQEGVKKLSLGLVASGLVWCCINVPF